MLCKASPWRSCGCPSCALLLKEHIVLRYGIYDNNALSQLTLCACWVCLWWLWKSFVLVGAESLASCHLRPYVFACVVPMTSEIPNNFWCKTFLSVAMSSFVHMRACMYTCVYLLCTCVMVICHTFLIAGTLYLPTLRFWQRMMHAQWVFKFDIYMHILLWCICMSSWMCVILLATCVYM